MIRNEAGPMFNKDFLCDDHFITSRDLEGEMWLRITSTCALVAIRDVHATVSISCTTYRKSEQLHPDFAGLALLTGLVHSTFDIKRRNLQQCLHAFILNEEKDFHKQRGVEFDPMIHDDRGWRMAFLEQPSSANTRASESLYITGPLAELRWPVICPDYGSVSEGDDEIDGKDIEGEDIDDEEIEGED